MYTERIQDIIDPEVAKGVATVLRGDNPAIAPISPESSARYGIPQTRRVITDSNLGDTLSSANVTDGREMSW